MVREEGKNKSNVWINVKGLKCRLIITEVQTTSGLKDNTAIQRFLSKLFMGDNMGLFGPDTKQINGETFVLEATVEGRELADASAATAREYGFHAHVKPIIRSNRQWFQVWVSETSTMRQASPPSEPAPLE